MSEHRISFTRPVLTGLEREYVNEAMSLGDIAGAGEFSRRCQSLLEQEVGSEKALLTPSCTSALEMAAILLEHQPGDEVIVPSFTFVSTVNAFVLHGWKPRFVDIREDTLNLNEELLESAITSRTRAIVPVHYAGVACEMDRILQISERHGLSVVEDNAHGLFGTYRHSNLGTHGQMATLSFHQTKNFTCGEGGALLINDARYVERAEIIRQKGTNRNAYFKGEVDKYTWVDLGSNFLLSDLNAAFLLAQLESRESIQAHRRNIWQRYASELAEWAELYGIRIPAIPSHCGQTWHTFYLILPTAADRDAFISHLSERSILSVFHYHPLHSSVMGKKFGFREEDCPVTEDISERLVRLPLYNNLSNTDLDFVISSIRTFAL